MIKESEQAAMEEFIDNIKILINALGYKVLEPLTDKDSSKKSDTLYLETANTKASCMITNEGFVVLKGAHLSAKMADTMPRLARDLREQCMADGRIVDDILQKDVLAPSPSSAASFVVGSAASALLYIGKTVMVKR